MTHSPLHGLNIVHQDPPAEASSSYLSDQQDLLSAPPFPDLAAQLDLWTNLTFQTDEPLLKDSAAHANDSNALDDADDDADVEGTASPDGHTNVVNPPVQQIQQQQQQHQQSNSAFDVNSILAGFGIDPYLVPPVTVPQPSQAASLAQLLSTYPFVPPPNLFGQPLSGIPIVPTLPLPAQPQAAAAAPVAPPSKRQRSRKTSSATAASPPVPSSSSPAPTEQSVTDIATTADASSFNDSKSIGTPLSQAEDKRRRNTAASARFRLKKKEREAALEQRSKELEMRVGELERECEALRRENGWLKGLVVGVTGASAGAGSVTGQTSAPGKRKRGAQDKSDVDSEGKKAVAAAV